MNRVNRISRLFVRGAGVFLLAVAAFGTFSSAASAQDTTTTTVRHGDSSFDTQVTNAEVVYVAGNDLVLKLEDGKVEHLIVPDSDTFTINGTGVTVHKLTPGTKLSQTIATTTAPRYVTTVRTLKGKVWHVSAHASTVILTLPNGANQSYTIPNHAKVTIGGRPKTVFDLRKGMNIEATIVTDDTHTVVEQSKSVVAQLPTPPPATPREVGVLLIYHPAPEESAVMIGSTEQPASTLPATGTSLPLLGLLGALTVTASVGLGAVRHSRKS
jgi:hypothetical protein